MDALHDMFKSTTIVIESMTAEQSQKNLILCCDAARDVEK